MQKVKKRQDIGLSAEWLHEVQNFLNETFLKSHTQPEVTQMFEGNKKPNNNNILFCPFMYSSWSCIAIDAIFFKVPSNICQVSMKNYDATLHPGLIALSS